MVLDLVILLCFDGCLLVDVCMRLICALVVIWLVWLGLAGDFAVLALVVWVPMLRIAGLVIMVDFRLLVCMLDCCYCWVVECGWVLACCLGCLGLVIVGMWVFGCGC